MHHVSFWKGGRSDASYVQVQKARMAWVILSLYTMENVLEYNGGGSKHEAKLVGINMGKDWGGKF